jgi:hypothetical protein
MTITECKTALARAAVIAMRNGNGWFEEGDYNLNAASHATVEAYAAEYNGCWLGNVNIYSDMPSLLPMFEYKIEDHLCNFAASFVVPAYDADLERMIRDRAAAPYTGTADDAVRVEAIHERIEQLGGCTLLWS